MYYLVKELWSMSPQERDRVLWRELTSLHVSEMQGETLIISASDFVAPEGLQEEEVRRVEGMLLELPAVERLLSQFGDVSAKLSARREMKAGDKALVLDGRVAYVGEMMDRDLPGEAPHIMRALRREDVELGPDGRVVGIKIGPNSGVEVVRVNGEVVYFEMP